MNLIKGTIKMRDCICDLVNGFISKLLEPMTLFTLGLVVFSYFQYLVQKKEHTLNLFNKRWQAFKDLQEIGKKAENWKHIYYQEEPSTEENYWTMYNKINLFADECEILFNKDIAKIGKETAEIFKSYHQTIDQIIDWDKYHEECPEQYSKTKRKDLHDTQVKASIQLLKLFDDWYKKMLTFIKNNKID